MQLILNSRSIEDYSKFLTIKRMPKYSIRGRLAEFPDDYAYMLGMTQQTESSAEYKPHIKLFDYQADITQQAIDKRKYALFIDCGLGKTLIYSEYALHVLRVLPKDRCILIISPLMVVEQTIAEIRKFYGGDYPIEQIKSSDLGKWLKEGKSRIGITNYEALKHHVEPGRLGCLILDESSNLKGHYGKYGSECIRLGKGLSWKLAGTGTPAPNDRIEYANHAVYLDQFPNVNSFLARFFVNKGQTNERWILKPHALEPFYRSLSHWAIFLSNPATYGWKDNTTNIPPIIVHNHFVELTEEQSRLAYRQSGHLIAHKPGGITKRSSWASIAKGWFRGKKIVTHKYDAIKDLVSSWPDESSIIWAKYNQEQDYLDEAFPDASSIRGDTDYDDRKQLIGEFKAGTRKQLISKPSVLGFGLNLQIATRMVFSTLMDSWESYYQAVKRANRVGSTKPLNVHIPYTDLELPMIENVMRKAAQIETDTKMQEELFYVASHQ